MTTTPLKLLTVQEVAAMAAISEESLQKWARQWRSTGAGEGPRPRLLSERLIRYYPPDVADWLGVSPREDHDNA